MFSIRQFAWQSWKRLQVKIWLLLKTACLFHDTGMMVTYRGHEEASVIICRDTLPGFSYTPEQIEAVEGMIITTKLPQCASDRPG